MEMITVGIGEMEVSTDQEKVFVAFGLGSCLGIAFYDPSARVAGLLHAMLPMNKNGGVEKPSKYVDSGIEEILMSMEKLGARRSRIVTRMAGGANMLNLQSINDSFQIGERNINSARQKLSELGLKIAGEQTGGAKGRTVHFYVKDGKMTIRKMGDQEVEV